MVNDIELFKSAKAHVQAAGCIFNNCDIYEKNCALHIGLAWKDLVLFEKDILPPLEIKESAKILISKFLGEKNKSTLEKASAFLSKCQISNTNEVKISPAFSDEDLAVQMKILSELTSEIEKTISPKSNQFKKNIFASVFLVALIFIATVIIFLKPHFYPNVWVGQIYKNQNFLGTPETIFLPKLFQINDIEFIPGFPTDNLSARFYSCIKISMQTTVEFELGSDDGSRLFVDNNLIIDNWGTHGSRALSGKTNLASGIHLISVDYFQGVGNASLFLKMKVGNMQISSYSKFLLLPQLNQMGIPGCPIN
jgi:hypothetical protein